MPDRTSISTLPVTPLGYIDSWHDGPTTISGRVTVQGWVLDAPPPRAILVAMNGEVVALARQGLPRPDVAAAYPDLPGSHASGWSAELDLGAQPHAEAMVAVQIIRANGQVALLGEAQLPTVARPAGPPAGLRGYLDLQPDRAQRPTGRVQVQGWVIDGTAPPLAVLVSVDGADPVLARLGIERPDVAAAFPDLPGARLSGWAAQVNLGRGVAETATVVVRVVRANGDAVVLGQAPLRDAAWVPVAPAGLMGHLDVFGDSGPLPTGRLRIQGWVIDTPPPLAVAVSIGGQAATLARLGRPRPDVAAAHPDLAGAAVSGWETTVEIDETLDDRTIVAARVLRADGELVQYGQAPFREVARPWWYPQATVGPVAPGVFGGIDPPSGNGLVVRGRLEVTGWAVDTGAAPVAVVVTIDGKGAALGRFGYPRHEEEKLYPGLDGVGTSGWAAHVDLADAPLGTVEVAAWLGRANGDFVQLGRMPMRILGGIDAVPRALITPTQPSAPRGGAPGTWQGTDERWAPATRRDAAAPIGPARHPDGRPITSEIHIPISPTPGFFTRVHYLAASLRRFGGVFADAKIVVTVGDDNTDQDLYALNPWSRHYPLEWRWLDRDLFSAYHYFATAVQRFCYDFTSDVVLLLDADTLIAGPLDDLFEEAVRQPSLYGVVTYISPARSISSVAPGDFWSALYQGVGLPPPKMVCEYPGWGVMDFHLSRDPGSRFTPPFFNLGFLCAPHQIMREIGAHIYQEMAASDSFHETVFRCQIGLCLALERHNIPWRSLAPRFNFGNVPALATGYPDDFDDVRVIHYFAGDDFLRDADIDSTEGVGKLLLRRDLRPVNARLRDALAEIHDAVLRERSANGRH